MARTAFILIVSSDPDRGQALRDALRDRYGHSCNLVFSLDDALSSIEHRAPDVVVADASLNGSLQGLAEQLGRASSDAELMTIGPVEAPAGTTVTTLPVDGTAERLASAIHRAASTAVARRQDRLLRQTLESQAHAEFEGIVGVSPAICKIIERIRKAARNKLTVLVVGETGTGKELIAAAIHKHSDRARRQFLAVNCAALPESLADSELFGHTRGAFTGAVEDKKGVFVAADSGTLFLDEIGDMPLSLQAKLLRVLEHREVRPIGATEVRRVDVRVIAATNADLRRMVQEGRFREDLYYRLHQWEIHVPPLRERRQDIPVLAYYLLKRANQAHGVSVEGFSSEAMACLTKNFWHGNVRELKNLVEVLACEVGSGQIEVEHLPESIRGSRELVPVSAGSMVGLTMAQMERLMIERTLAATDGNREQAARMLDIGTRTLYRKIKEYGL